jgi:LysM repeat protein
MISTMISTMTPTSTMVATAEPSATAGGACTAPLPIVATPIPIPGVLYYEVQPRDTLSKIANSHGITEDALVAANIDLYPVLRLDRDCLRVGWVLVIPV